MSLPTYPSEKPENPDIKNSTIGRLLGTYASLFCAGCGYGIVGHIYTRVFEEEKLDPLLYPLVIGIGCYTQIITLALGAYYLPKLSSLSEKTELRLFFPINHIRSPEIFEISSMNVFFCTP